jgi:hypothetical protein
MGASRHFLGTPTALQASKQPDEWKRQSVLFALLQRKQAVIAPLDVSPSGGFVGGLSMKPATKRFSGCQ